MNKNKRIMATQTLAYCALLMALSVVLARLMGLMPEQSARFSLESVPIFLAGMLFGPVAGGMVGFGADFVGCLFSAYGYNPIFCVPPILYGVFAGLFRHWLAKGVTIPRLAAVLLLPIPLGSVLYQSCTLSYMYYDGAFLQGLVMYLTTRGIQFSIMLVLDTLVVWLLVRAGIFERMGIWPPKRKERGSCDDSAASN